MYRVAFTGHRPSKLGFFGEDDPMCVDLKQRLAKKIRQLAENGADEFYSGMALGVDIWCAQAVLELKQDYPQIKLMAIIPCRSQSQFWNDEDTAIYQSVLDQCDKVICISSEYTRDCMHKRNRALVDICDVLLAVYDGTAGGTQYTVKYAQKKGRKIIFEPPM